MSGPQRRSASETWKALEAMAEDDAAEREMDRISALEPEAVDRELAAAGIDPVASRLRGEAVARRVALLAAPSPAARRVSPRTLALLVAAVVAIALLLVWSHQRQKSAHPRAAPPAPERAAP